jgi:hypothetical protein
MSSIQATEDDTTTLLELLETISSQQENICKMLDDLIRLLDMPSSDVLKVLSRLLVPMSKDLGELTTKIKPQLMGLANLTVPTNSS